MVEIEVVILFESDTVFYL